MTISPEAPTAQEAPTTVSDPSLPVETTTADEREDLRSSVRALFADSCPLSHVREFVDTDQDYVLSITPLVLRRRMLRNIQTSGGQGHSAVDALNTLRFRVARSRSKSRVFKQWTLLNRRGPPRPPAEHGRRLTSWASDWAGRGPRRTRRTFSVLPTPAVRLRTS